MKMNTGRIKIKENNIGIADIFYVVYIGKDIGGLSRGVAFSIYLVKLVI